MAVGRHFGPYTLQRKLARGGMADIFLATRRAEDGEELCVIKMMLPSSLRDPRALKLFLGEARLAARLEHPNIVRILERDRVDDYYFIAMEYVPGETLYHLLHQAAHCERPVRPDEAAAIVVQACNGLTFAHAMTDVRGQALNLVHRDVSPSNLILSYEGKLKILDFGIAATDTRPLDIPKGKAFGKHGYMSPEQCRGGKLDRQSDIFSLGVVFWELLTGRSLFPSRDPKAIMAKVLAGDIPPPTSVRPDISATLERAVLRSLSPAPRDRYKDARSMALAIGETYIDAPMPDESDLAAMMVDLFGERRARLSEQGDVGEEIELATLLFDDLEAERRVRGERPSPRREPTRRRSVLSRTTIVLLALAVVLFGVALGVVAWVEIGWHGEENDSGKARRPRGAVMVDSTPNGGRPDR